jgi:hypothetical protein
MRTFLIGVRSYGTNLQVLPWLTHFPTQPGEVNMMQAAKMTTGDVSVR